MVDSHSDLPEHVPVATPVRAPARLRSRNQLTLPNEIVEAAGIAEGDAFVVELEPTDPDVVVLRRVRASYAGALKGMYGPVEEYLEGERAGWD
jgi:bifunctional DNA-binding transcriptional regulator/antitoxin component of YhaV-PrlF toxin-antitoxin module